MIDLSHEQARTYFWVTETPPPPSIKMTQPKSLTINEYGEHIIEGSDNCVYHLRNWAIIKIELKGGVPVDAESKIIVS